MFTPSYQISPEVLNLVSEISEQIGTLETLTNHSSMNYEAPYNPYQEDDLQRAHEKLSDGLSVS